jgi:N-acetylmuramoyl-L-alanine amidase
MAPERLTALTVPSMLVKTGFLYNLQDQRILISSIDARRIASRGRL